MKPFYKFFVLLSVFTIIQSSLICQEVYYEMPFIITDGVVKCRRIVVGFNENVIPTDRGITNVDTKVYPIQNNDIKNLLERLSELYGTPTIRKSIPRLVWGDTLIINKRTGEISVGPDMSQSFRIDFPMPVPMDSVLSLFKEITVVKYAEYPVVISPAVFPNDYHFVSGDQWYLNNTGQNGGTPDADIDAPEAWDITKGSSTITVAFIDSKAQIKIDDHEDLAGKFISGSSLEDGSEHSSSVAGLIAASTNNNGIGIASLGWNTSLFAKHFINDENGFTTLESQIDLASQSADVINFSFNTLGFDCNPTKLCPTDYDNVLLAIRRAMLAGVVLVAAADNNPYPPYCPPNCGSTIPFQSYPASYAGVIAVTAKLHHNQLYRRTQSLLILTVFHFLKKKKL